MSAEPEKAATYVGSSELGAERTRALIAVIAVVGVHSLTVGYTYPAISFNLEARGFSSTIIGLQTAISGLGILLGSIATPFAVQRFGSWPTAAGCMLVTIIAIMSFGLTEDIRIWYPLRFFLSGAGGALFVVSETWLNQLAPDHMRGRLVGIYTSVVAGLFALGPLLIPVIGFSGAWPFVVVGGALAVLGAPIFLLRGRAPEIENVSARALVRTLGIIPLLLLTVACFGFFDAAVLGLWGVYALGEGIAINHAAFLLTMLVIGNVFLQVPLGWLADRYSRRRLLSICALAGLVGAIFLPFVDLASWWTVPYLVVWGALAFGTYTLAMTLVGQHLRGGQLVAANAGFSLMWGVGNLVGAAVTGPLMDAIGNNGFPISIAVAFTVLFIATLVMVPVRTAISVLREGLEK